MDRNNDVTLWEFLKEKETFDDILKGTLKDKNVVVKAYKDLSQQLELKRKFYKKPKPSKQHNHPNVFTLGVHTQRQPIYIGSRRRFPLLFEKEEWTKSQLVNFSLDAASGWHISSKNCMNRDLAPRNCPQVKIMFWKSVTLECLVKRMVVCLHLLT